MSCTRRTPATSHAPAPGCGATAPRPVDVGQPAVHHCRATWSASDSTARRGCSLSTSGDGRPLSYIEGEAAIGQRPFGMWSGEWDQPGMDDALRSTVALLNAGLANGARQVPKATRPRRRTP
jgi:hypothetical protein